MVSCRVVWQDVDGDTPLIVACNMEDEQLAAHLLTSGCRVDAAGYEANTALHRAAESGNVALVRLLVDHDADTTLTNAAGNTPLMIACDSGHVDVVRYLLQHSQTAADSPRPLQCANADGRTCLHLAAVAGSVELADLLLEAGVSAYEVDAAGNTALVLAVWSRNFDLASALLRAAAAGSCGLADYVNLPGELGRGVIHWAAVHGVVPLLDELWAAVGGWLAVDRRDAAGDTPLVLAARAGHTPALRWLLDRGLCAVNWRGDGGRTALHWAVLVADRDAVEYLLAIDGVAPALSDQDGCTPLLLAAAHHRYAEMRTILRTVGGSDADVDRQDADGRTALHWVCKVRRHHHALYSTRK